MSWLSDILSRGLAGHDAHIAPSKVVQNLAHRQAVEIAEGQAHSAWELLYHIVFWQDLCLRAIAGKRVDWKAAEGEEWPTPALQDEQRGEELCEQFLAGIEEAERLVQTRDLQTALESWGDAPVAKAFLVLIQHNSYHLGQIVSVRRALGQWPPGS